MKPIKFEQQNITYKKPESMTDEQCGSLPACKHENGIVSCWGMSVKERIKVLFTGRIWFDIVSHAQPPIWLGVDSPFMRKEE
jgi:hypothetical protein